jgi:hypothetical protein
MTSLTAVVKPLSQATSPDLRSVPAALERAFLRAQTLAKQTNTFLIVQQNGQLVKLKVN